MENSNSNPTGSKGVFPGGAMPNHTGAQNTEPAQEVQMPQLNIPEAQQPAQPQTQPQAQPAQPQAPIAPQAAATETNTYMSLETKNPEGLVSGILEIDLISFRERGQESRYLSINTTGSNQTGEQSDTTISIDNEDDFNRLKMFISKLNWND